MASGLGGFFERWKSDWIDPAFEYIESGQRPKTDSHLNEASNEYTEEELKASTKNFDQGCLLGSGTFGSVYRGTMTDGTEVAIKVLQVPEEAGFEEEVKVLSRFRHPNLVILMGFARHAETGWRSLVYEFLAGGDVSRRLQRSRQEKEPFEWRPRLSAGVDAACGLSHLHNMSPRAFHRDIKGPNILLDKNGTAKMADFGLSCVSSGSQHKVQQASGTVGYACPEYIRTGIITEGSEVHSFGMVLLELLTGAPPAVVHPDKPGEFCYLVDHLQGSKAKVMQMLDKTGHFPAAVSQALTDAAFRCITPNPVERPLFKQLVEELRELYLSSASNGAGGGSAAAPGPSASRDRGASNDGAAGLAGNGIDQTLPGREQPAKGQQGQQGPPGVRRVALVVGTPVTARRRGSLHWCRGRIVHASRDGSFGIQYEDGEIEHSVPANYIRAADVQPTPQGWRSPQADADEGYGPVPPPPPPPERQARPNAAGAAPLGAAGPAAQLPAPPPRPKAPAMANGERRSMTPWSASPAQASAPQGQASEQARDLDPSAIPPFRLWCVYAEGVDLTLLSQQQRAIQSLGTQELVLGRTAQPNAVWDTLVPDRRLHGTVSREHFKVIARRAPTSGSGGHDQVSFALVCMSLNGVMLNGTYTEKGPGEHTLQHGDVVALAVGIEASGSGPLNGASKKPFVVFQFEVMGPSPAAAAIPTKAEAAVPAVPPVPAAPPPDVQRGPFDELDGPRGEELQRPPAGKVAGRWRTSADAAAPADALYCLEVHGDEVREDLPAEARQLFFCCENGGGAWPSAPALRVGRYYQRGFWQRVLRDDLLTSGSAWSSLMGQDHFDILPMRRNNPQLAEPPDWRFKLQVLSAAGVTLNYSVVCTAGDERELCPSDTLTVSHPSRSSSSRPEASSGEASGSRSRGPPGLHMTFIPLVGQLSQPRSAEPDPQPLSPKLPPELPKQLPELSDSEDEGGFVAQRRRIKTIGAMLPSTGRAGALRPPTSVLTGANSAGSFHEEEGLPASSPIFPAASSQESSLQPGYPTPAKTSILGPPRAESGDGGEPDDLFAKTGFQSNLMSEVEAHVPDESEDVPVYDAPSRSRNTRRTGQAGDNWLPNLGC
eukprot:TRINITY_DN76779_c0_g1_i1.p1 TRINITY_DN76779_c0_g1~~TRINITY_DN76779_c0_g1_i1.p1  ORF type:complete len:1111 (-),score=216.91 TRINITY_DN76779_c0_g1_i1:84-3416(-)